MDNKEKKTTIPRRRGFTKTPQVFFGSAGLILLLLILALIFQETAQTRLNEIQNFIGESFGWFFILTVDLYLIFVIIILFSPMGKVRLGGDKAKPDFGFLSWFAMLFSAGMGIGLVFYGVAEPMYHFADPARQGTEPGTVEAARSAMQVTFFHWGLHAWGIYALVGLALAFFAYNKGLPLSIRSALYPLIGDRVHGWIGDVVDIVAVVATLFGVATSLGVGVTQVSSGLNFLFGSPTDPWFYAVLIAVITLAATASVVSGLDKGIKMLSVFNLVMATLLLTFVLIAGPTLFLLKSIVQNTGNYLGSFMQMSFWTEAYQSSGPDAVHWQTAWTIFYWAWWISWSPFVGMFIARVSRGRTVREFLLGVLLAPTIVTFIWMTVFGSSGIFIDLFGEGGISDAVQDEMPVALFVLLEQFPLAGLTAALSIIVVVTFFVTSSDSGSMVIDVITSGGNPHPPVATRIFWALLEGTVAAVLLLIGGQASLGALQTAAIMTALPFAVVLLVMCFGLWKGLSGAVAEKKRETERASFRRDREAVDLPS